MSAQIQASAAGQAEAIATGGQKTPPILTWIIRGLVAIATIMIGLVIVAGVGVKLPLDVIASGTGLLEQSFNGLVTMLDKILLLPDQVKHLAVIILVIGWIGAIVDFKNNGPRTVLGSFLVLAGAALPHPLQDIFIVFGAPLMVQDRHIDEATPKLLIGLLVLTVIGVVIMWGPLPQIVQLREWLLNGLKNAQAVLGYFPTLTYLWLLGCISYITWHPKLDGTVAYITHIAIMLVWRATGANPYTGWASPESASGIVEFTSWSLWFPAAIYFALWFYGIVMVIREWFEINWFATGTFVHLIATGGWFTLSLLMSEKFQAMNTPILESVPALVWYIFWLAVYVKALKAPPYQPDRRLPQYFQVVYNLFAGGRLSLPFGVSIPWDIILLWPIIFLVLGAIFGPEWAGLAIK